MTRTQTTKLFKKLFMTFLTLAMVFGIVNIKPVAAAELNVENGSYAIVADGKALEATADGWGTPVTMTGIYSGTQNKVSSSSILTITNSSEEGWYNIEATGFKAGVHLKSESLDAAAKYVFANSETLNTDYNFKFEVSDSDVSKVKIITYRGYYLYIGDDGRILRTTEPSQATEFTLVKNPEVLDTTVTIKNVATGKYVSFESVDESSDEWQDIYVDKDTVTDNEKFDLSYATNNDGIANVIDLKSIGKPGFKLATDRWQATEDHTYVKAAKSNEVGGWTAVAVVPAGDDAVYLKDVKNGNYITVDENNVLAGGYTGEVTDREKFILSYDMESDPVSSLSIEDSTRTQTTLDLSWSNPTTVYTKQELWQQASNETVASKIADLTEETSYQVTGLNPGMEYTYFIRTYNGTLMVQSESISAKTRVGDKPATPTNVQIKESGNDKVVISWDKAENATHYKLQWAPSAYGTYSDVENGIVKDATSIEVTLTGNKYENYYRVVAINNGASDTVGLDAEYSDVSKFVSLETNLFGDHTIIFADTDETAQIDDVLLKLYEQQSDANADAQFKAGQYQVYFKPGDYTDTTCMYLGFYTSFNGLGKTPYDVKLNNVAIPAYLSDNNATCNFWRSMENVSIINTGNEQGKAQYGSWRQDQFNWAVAQAAPLRRIYSERPIAYDWNYGWASGGYVADSKVVGTFNDNGNELSAGTFSGQQFYTRNSEFTGNVYGCTLNNFFQGVKAPNLPDATTGETLLSGNGYSNWNIADSSGSQQVFTNIETTKEISEKPFLYIDDDGEYRVFVPAVRENTKGTSWSENDMGEGKSIPLSEFYIASPDDSAATINEMIADGKNIYFTPGTYHAEEPILVSLDDTILLGTGMTSIIPDNEEAAMIIDDDVTGIKLAGIIFDAGEHSEYLLKVGIEKNNNDNSDDPIVLQDLFFRIGGTTDELTKADNALEINTNDVLCDHFWIWRADHGAGVEWYGNESAHGLIVNGDDVICYALFNEHFQDYNTLWNGENGATYFYQNETAYDPISQDVWMSHNGTVNGYASYKVANNVKNHYAVGLGIYNVFIYTGESYDSSEVQIQLDNAIEVPNSENVIVENACLQTFAKDDGALQKINSIINGVGDGVSSGTNEETGLKGEGWSRKFLLSYQNGTAVVGKATNGNSANFGKYIGVDTITDIKQLGEDGLDVASMQGLYDQYQNLNETDYTKESWEALQAVVTKVETMLSNDYLKYDAVKADFDKVMVEFETALDKLVPVTPQQPVDKTQLQEVYDNYSKLDESQYTADSYEGLKDALVNALAVLNNENATQEEVDAAYQAVQTAYKSLELVETTPDADKTQLQAIYDQYNDIDESLYTKESYGALTSALEDALAVLNNENATQEEVDAALTVLQEAYEGLVAVEPQPGDDNTNPGEETGDKDPGNTGNNNSSQTETNKPQKTTGKGAKTGDDSTVVLFATLGLLSTGGYVALRRIKDED